MIHTRQEKEKNDTYFFSFSISFNEIICAYKRHSSLIFLVSVIKSCKCYRYTQNNRTTEENGRPNVNIKKTSYYH